MLKFKNYISETDLTLQEIYHEALMNGTLFEGYIPPTGNSVGQKDFLEQFIKYAKGYTIATGAMRLKNLNDKSEQEIINDLTGFLGSYLLDDIDVIPANVGENRTGLKPDGGIGQGSGKYSGYFFDLNLQSVPKIGKNIPVVLVVMGGTGFNAAESEVTDKQETAKLLVLAAMHKENIKNVNDITYDNVKDVSKSVYIGEKTISDNRVQEIMEWIDTNEIWKIDTLRTATIMKKQWSGTPIKYVKDDAGLTINKMASKLWKLNPLVKEQGLRYNNDKWNPADVWLYYSDAKDVNSFKTLTELNDYLRECVKSAELGKPTGILGISLKQITGEGKLEYYNTSEVSKPMRVIPNENTIKYGVIARFGDLFTQNVYVDYNIGTDKGETDVWSITYRIFAGKPNDLIRGEATKRKSKARHGKVAIPALNRLNKKMFKSSTADLTKLANAVRGDGILEWDGSRYGFTSIGKKRFRTVQNYWKLIKSAISRGIIYN